MCKSSRSKEKKTNQNPKKPKDWDFQISRLELYCNIDENITLSIYLDFVHQFFVQLLQKKGYMIKFSLNKEIKHTHKIHQATHKPLSVLQNTERAILQICLSMLNIDPKLHPSVQGSFWILVC